MDVKPPRSASKKEPAAGETRDYRTWRSKLESVEELCES